MFGLPFISNKGKRVKSLLRQRGISIDDSRTINRKSQRRPDRKYAYGPRLCRGQVPANRMIIAGDDDERSPPCINNSLWQSVSLSNLARVPPLRGCSFSIFNTVGSFSCVPNRHKGPPNFRNMSISDMTRVPGADPCKHSQVA